MGQHSTAGGADWHVCYLCKERHVLEWYRRGPRVEGERPLPRGGAVAAMLSPFEALVLTGNDHENEEEMVAPHVMKLVLPE